MNPSQAKYIQYRIERSSEFFNDAQLLAPESMDLMTGLIN